MSTRQPNVCCNCYDCEPNEGMILFGFIANKTCVDREGENKS